MQQAYAVPTGTYAGFWRRFVAYLIDVVIIAIPAAILAAIIGALAGAAASSAQSGSTAATGAFSGLFVLLYIALLVGTWLYFALMESSSSQATLGKMALGIRVTDVNGQRLTFGRATGRYF